MQRSVGLCRSSSSVPRFGFFLPSSSPLRTFSSSAFVQSGRSSITLTNPATEERVVFSEPHDDAVSIKEKFQKAKLAQSELGGWAARSNLEGRKAAIQKFYAALQKKEIVDEAAKNLSLDMGKPLSQAQGEVSSTLGRVRFFLDNIDQVMKDDVVHKDGQMTEIIRPEPLGVVANISAWNYPWFVGTNAFIPALLTGNAVLYKPSEFALRTGKFMTDLLHESGVPKELFAPVYGDGKVGEAILQQPIDGVFFTGSVSTGLKINQAVASRAIKVQLELGGKDPAYVLPDVDIKNAAAVLADGAFYNTGQSCCSVERIYVHESIYEPFLQHFVEEVKGFSRHVGGPFEDKVYIGPVVQKKQLDFLEKQVQDAVSKGAKLLLGGKRYSTSEFAKGYFFQPTVLTEVNSSMDVMKEESFGPIIGIQKVSSDEEALLLMNDTKYGLTASVFTKDKERALTLLSRLNVGTAYWNCCDRVSPHLPWSGRNFSGLGLTLSVEGIRTFTQPKALHLKQL
ncbi:Aldehyde dehydrogenase [Balamuthia mandrillaris]